MFLETLLLNNGMVSGGIIAALIAFLLAFLLFAILIGIALYLYMSLAYMSIAKKARYKTPAIAWIPIIGPSLIVSKTAKMPWWPILLLLGGILPWIGGLFSIAFMVFFIMWHWKTFEILKWPNWMSILLIIPIVNLVIIGIVAWSKK